MTRRDLSLAELQQRLPSRLGRRITAVDSHTAGESTRVLLGGMPEPQGCASVADARRWMQRDRDHLRRFVTCEPRGHRDLVGAWITPAYAPEADFGVVFMDAKRYPYACGTATIGSITTMVELGLVTPREGGEVVVDTPAGLIRAQTERDDEGRVRDVTLGMVPSCVCSGEIPLTLADGLELRASLVFVGGYLALVSSDQLPAAMAPEHAPELVALGEAVIEAANAQHAVDHPVTGERTTIDGAVLYDPSGDGEGRGYGTVIYGASHLDRSPCGTGTTAKMTLLHHRGRLGVDERYENRGILGTSFEGTIAEVTTVGERPGVRARIRASAHLVSVHELCLDEADPFPEGFVLG